MTGADEGSAAQQDEIEPVGGRFETYREFSERLIDASTVEEVAAVAIDSFARLVGAEGAAIRLVEGPEGEGGSISEYASPEELWESIPEPTRRGIMDAVLRGEGVLSEGEASSLLSREGLPPAPQLRSLIAAELATGPNCRGALIALNLRRPEGLSNHYGEVESLGILACHAIERVRLAAARERQARLLGAVLERTNSHIAYLDRDFNFVLVNRTYEQGCGHSREELIGRNHFDLFPNEENERIFQRVRNTGEAVEYREKPFEYADQPERGVTYWDWTLTPVKDEQGRVEGLVLSLTDQTETVRARDRALAAERARAALAETLASEVNHRMKNNLAMVAGLLEMQQREPKEGRGAGPLADAAARIRSIAAVHDQLYERRSEQVELLDACRRIGGLACEGLAVEDVEVTVEGDTAYYPPGVGTALCVVGNELVTNALKHGGRDADGRRRIAISVSLQGGKLTLAVWNSGNPVRRDFEAVAPGHRGLHLVSAIAVEQYGGSFAVQPQRGGTTAEVMIEDGRLRTEA